jgi:hypothetical protein
MHDVDFIPSYNKEDSIFPESLTVNELANLGVKYSKPIFGCQRKSRRKDLQYFEALKQTIEPSIRKFRGVLEKPFIGALHVSFSAWLDENGKFARH